MSRSRSKYLLVLAFLALFLRGSASFAEQEPGVTVTVYNNYWYNASPPLPTVSGRPVVGTLRQQQVLNNFDQQPLFNMYEDFIVKYEAHITAPCSCDVRFMALADDGTLLYLDGQLITNDWVDKGGGGSVSNPVAFNAGVSKQLLLWFYENGGGAWVELWWMIDDTWDVVPASAFSVSSVTTTTSTTTTSTTSTTTTTTTLPATTTTEPSTTLPAEPSTTATNPTTTSTTTTVNVPTTEYLDNTTTSTTPETTKIWTTTTASIPSATVTTTTVIPSTTLGGDPVSTTVATATTVDEGSTPSTSTVTAAQAAAIATDPAKVATLSQDEAQQVFAALELDELTDEQVTELVAAVQDAPQEVRAAFEEEVDIFSGGALDTYVPLGSTVPVSTRRALIVITTVTAVAAAASRRKW